MKKRTEAEIIEAVNILAALSWSISKIARLLQCSRGRIAKMTRNRRPLERAEQDLSNRNVATKNKPNVSQKRCLNCKRWFYVDSRHQKRQSYCHRKACREVSKKKSQAKWASSNPDYWKSK